MNKFTKFVGTLAFACVTGCVTQPAPIPPYLAEMFAHQGIREAASISYQDQHGRPISESEFGARFDRRNGFKMTTTKRGNDWPDVTMRLGEKTPDEPVLAAPKLAQPQVDSAQASETTTAIVDFRTCPRPIYPSEELRARHTGTVALNFLIGIDGYVKKAELTASSGFPGLDQAAMVALVRCRFKPATSAGVPQEKWSPVKYVWTMS